MKCFVYLQSGFPWLNCTDSEGQQRQVYYDPASCQKDRHSLLHSRTPHAKHMPATCGLMMMMMMMMMSNSSLFVREMYHMLLASKALRGSVVFSMAGFIGYKNMNEI